MPVQEPNSGGARRFRYDCTLRWSDMDSFGHVNNAVFCTYYEEARVAMMFVGAREQGFESFEVGVVVARTEIDYLRPVEYDTQLPSSDVPPKVQIEVWASNIRRASFTIHYELYNKGQLAGRALSVMVPFDLTLGRPRRLTEPERKFLYSYAEPDDAAAAWGTA